jgi:deferrochelatase/peroxidase EfeB
MSRVELDDIQGLVRFAYKNLTEAVFLLLQVRDAVAARAWLAQVAPADAVSRIPPPSTAVQIALTSQGLRALGIDSDTINAFSSEFVAGMAGDSSRSRRLGDLGSSDPSQWQWGAGDRLPDAAVLLYAAPGRLEDLQRTIEIQCSSGFQIIERLATSDMGGREPFGFVDGISQPELDWDRKRPAQDSTQLTYINPSCLGEFLLGYPNEYGLYTPRPLLAPSQDRLGILPRAEDATDCADLGRNGSYLVIRQLRQNVPAFWQALDQYVRGVAADRDLLAAALVGRTLSGEPLEPVQDAASESSATSVTVPPPQFNAFDYRSDPQGTRCPLGAHVRRVNPRNADFPPGSGPILSRLARTLGLNATARALDLEASTRFHRLLRRGREYGVSMTTAEALASQSDVRDQGLQFICLNANVQRQFEFVQSAWLMGSKFDGLHDESDPLLGNRIADKGGLSTDNFSLPQADGPCRRLRSLPQFITVLGGAYLFLPGIRALRFLSSAHA